MVSLQPYEPESAEKDLADARTMFGTVRENVSDTATLRYPSHLASGERSPDWAVPYPCDRWMGPPPPLRERT